MIGAALATAVLEECSALYDAEIAYNDFRDRPPSWRASRSCQGPSGSSTLLSSRPRREPRGSRASSTSTAPVSTTPVCKVPLILHGDGIPAPRRDHLPGASGRRRSRRCWSCWRIDCTSSWPQMDGKQPPLTDCGPWSHAFRPGSRQGPLRPSPKAAAPSSPTVSAGPSPAAPTTSTASTPRSSPCAASTGRRAPSLPPLRRSRPRSRSSKTSLCRRSFEVLLEARQK